MPKPNNDELIYKELLKCLSELNSNLKAYSNNNIVELDSHIGDIMVEEGKGSGKFIKISKSTYYQEMYNDVAKLKRDTTDLIEDYQSNIKPLVKKLNDTLPHIDNRFKDIENSVIEIQKNRPKSFSVWMSEKGDFFNNTGLILKGIFWIFVTIYIISQALPSLINLFKSLSTQ